MGTVMAFLAKERRARFQQGGDVGAVWGVAISAVFCHRLVLEQEGAAFFSVALVASLGHGVLFQKFGARGTVWVVAICASHFAFFKGVVRYFFAVSTLLFVAGVANLGLGFFAQNLVSWTVHLVAIVASHTAGLVFATVPIVALGIFVASQALTGTLFVFRDFESAFLEDHIGGSTAFCIGVALDVLVAFAVAGLAAGGTGITAYAVLGLVKR